MHWNGQNRTETGASLRPLGTTIGMEAYGVDPALGISEREGRRLARALRHRHVLCLRRQIVSSAEMHRYLEPLNMDFPVSVLAAPANLTTNTEIAFIDQDLSTRTGGPRPEFIYRHNWRAGDMLLWTSRLALIA